MCATASSGGDNYMQRGESSDAALSEGVIGVLREGRWAESCPHHGRPTLSKSPTRPKRTSTSAPPRRHAGAGPQARPPAARGMQGAVHCADLVRGLLI